MLLADDHQVVLDTLNDMLSLEPDIEVVGAETDGWLAVEGSLRLSPDILVLDIFMPGCSGLSAMQSIRQALPDQRILVLTISERAEDLRQAFRYGAQGYILKRDSIRDIVSAVRRIAAGEIVMSPRLIIWLISEFRRNSGEWNTLNEPEKRVLQLFEVGVAVPAIAGRLHIDESRVRGSLQLFLIMLRYRIQAEARLKGETERFTKKRD